MESKMDEGKMYNTYITLVKNTNTNKNLFYTYYEYLGKHTVQEELQNNFL